MGKLWTNMEATQRDTTVIHQLEAIMKHQSTTVVYSPSLSVLNPLISQLINHDWWSTPAEPPVLTADHSWRADLAQAAAVSNGAYEPIWAGACLRKKCGQLDHPNWYS